ncbi:toll/interleukin-1 receptor domain-containing protein [Nesterenkonia sp. CF4.4]|uniref:toll/interleukin-1 receptor domain-containing protein n=1 Tax=Nesterenkonia sp. CF4.4 TaxID=3373079 RepID=UPI003EE78C76
MSNCTAPSQGHRTSSGAASCPVHGGRGGYGYSRPSYPSYGSSVTPVRRVGSPTGSAGGSGGRRTARPSWSPSTSTVSYTPQEVRDLEDVRTAVEARTQSNDVFLCHAWADRRDDAKDFYDLLLDEDLSVWFSEVSLTLGTDMRAAIDKGLVSSRVGIVLVTPAMLDRLRTDRSVAGSELSALLRRNLLVPVLHRVTFEELDQVSPTLASRGGLSTSEDSKEDIAVKISELVGTLDGD